jgi:hypothetical protein
MGAKSYWVFGLFPSSAILESMKHNVSENGSVFFLSCDGKTYTQLRPLDIANLNHELIEISSV